MFEIKDMIKCVKYFFYIKCIMYFRRTVPSRKPGMMMMMNLRTPPVEIIPKKEEPVKSQWKSIPKKKKQKKIVFN